MSRRRAALGTALNAAVLVALSTAAVVGLVRSPGLDLTPAGWVFTALWVAAVLAIFVRNAVVCARRRYVVWRPPWQAPPPGAQRVR